MKRKIIKFVLVLFFLQSVIVFANSDYQAKLVSLKGKVYYKVGLKDNFKIAKLGTKLKGNYFVKTGKKSKAIVKLLNGSLITLDRNTMIFINDVLPSKKKSKKALGLCFGKIKLAVKKLKKKDQFEVMTPTAVAGVRGTEFSVETLSDGSAIVKVKKGKVQVDSGDQSVDVNKKENVGVDFSNEKLQKKIKESSFRKEKKQYSEENPNKVLEKMSSQAQNMQKNAVQLTNDLDENNYSEKYNEYIKNKSSVVTMSALADNLYNKNKDNQKVGLYYKKLKAIDDRFNEVSAMIDKKFNAIDEMYEKRSKAIDEKSETLENLLDKKIDAMDKKLESDK